MKFKTSFKNLSISEFGITFVNGEYETKDKKEIEYLKKFDFITGEIDLTKILQNEKPKGEQ